ncbi:MAG: biotin/lipoyl-binding protein [Bacteroidales bacterium]|nr:biotin/lipoyl-binding protein [Bacteroidales bacterium]
MKEYKLKINGNNYNVVVDEVGETEATVEVNGTQFKVEYEQPVTKSAPKVTVIQPTASASHAAPVAAAAPVKAAAPASTGGETVSSPLPGIVLELKAKEGDVVKRGQVLMVLEAMKMENNIEAPCDGTVAAVKVNKGDSVLEGAPLYVIK